MSTLNINTLSEETFEQKEQEHSVLSTELYIVDDSNDDHRTVVPSYDLIRNTKQYTADVVKCSYDVNNWIAAEGGRTAAYGKVDGKGVYVIGTATASSYNPGSYCYVLSSTDGINFNPITIKDSIFGESRFNSIVYDDTSKAWYAGRIGVHKSTDLVNWSETNFPKSKIAKITVIDGKIYAAFETTDGVVVSEDGGNSVETLCNTYAIEHIAKKGNTFVGAPMFNTDSPLIKDGVFVSTDGGNTWTNVVDKLPGFNVHRCGGIKVFNDKFIVRCNYKKDQKGGAIYWSNDGIDWTLCKGTYPTSSYDYADFFSYDLIADPNNKFLVAIPYNNENEKARIIITTDGEEWYPVYGTERGKKGNYGYYGVWTEQGIACCGCGTDQAPFFLKNIRSDFKINLLADAMRNIPVLASDASTEQIVDAINVITKAFR